DPSGFIFDVQSNTVMAQGGTFENMKEKISAVRAIVPNRSNNEIVLVLQHFDNCVDRTVQAFMEGNASEVLKEWTVTGKKKNKKKKPKPKPPADPNPGGHPDGSRALPPDELQPEKAGVNGFHVNGCSHDVDSGDSLSEGLDALSLELEDGDTTAPRGTALPDLAKGLAGSDPKPLTLQPQSPQAPRQQRPEGSSSSWPLSPAASSLTAAAAARLQDGPIPPTNRKMGSNIEKSVKDLQRCTVSLARYHVVLKEEMEASIKKMKQVFAELQSSLMDREVALLAEMDKVKAEAMELLQGRQRKAEALRRLTEAAARLSEEQLLELRADIKHFVSERKFDEELGRSARFSCDLEGLKRSIAAFGQVSHPKNSYSSRPRCPSGATPSTPPAAPSPVGASAPTASSPAATKKPSASSPSSGSSSRPPQLVREAPQGSSRRPGGRGGPRAQGQRQIGPPSRQQSSPGQQQPAPPASSPGQSQPPRPPPDPKGLPQRKPRASRQGGGSS
ncbi:SPAS2 protein, partial [Rhinopomastus cyanomelas]|nr:SPAS2 protein [Rhinopomastus cyanomelas]